MHKIILAASVAVLALNGCATKRYPIASELSAVEKSELTCRELQIELGKVEETQAKIADTAEIDWRSGAGFLGDFGIGNAMAKSEAEKALATRRLGIREAQANKNCLGM